MVELWTMSNAPQPMWMSSQPPAADTFNRALEFFAAVGTSRHTFPVGSQRFEATANR